jgi:hypothetical protein
MYDICSKREYCIFGCKDRDRSIETAKPLKENIRSIFVGLPPNKHTT